MGRKLRMCSRKYRDWKKRSPKKVKRKLPSRPKKAASTKRNAEKVTLQKQSEDNVANTASQKKVVTTMSSLHSIIELPQGWYDHTTPDLDLIRLCKVTDTASSSSQPLIITHSIIVKSDFSWKLFVHNCEVRKCSALSNIPPQLDETSLPKLISLVDMLHVCSGHPESKFVTFVDSRKGKLFNKSGGIAAYVDHYAPVYLNEEIFHKTVRTSDCEMLVHGQKCDLCSSYRRTLRVLQDRWSKRSSDELSSSSSHTNDRYLNTPEKLAKVANLRQRVKNAENEVMRLKERLRNLIESSESVDQGLHDDLSTIMSENTNDIQKAFPEGSFRRVFWDQQLENSKKGDARQYRWHPLMIKWCLNLKLMSSAAYHAMRTSGFVTLPSERTLRDYTTYIKCVPGYQQEVVDMRKESKCDELPESKRYVTIILDEMKVKENIVYDKTTGNIIGFCNLGKINDELLQYERSEDVHPPVAKQILAVMVRGLFFKFEFPLAHFSTEGATGDLLYPIVWEGIRNIESTGLKVLAVTADGASPNRKFFRMHGSLKDGVVYKTKNLYAFDDRDVYFFSDAPHLIKTTRNCLSHSNYASSSRSMMV